MPCDHRGCRAGLRGVPHDQGAYLVTHTLRPMRTDWTPEVRSPDGPTSRPTSSNAVHRQGWLMAVIRRGIAYRRCSTGRLHHYHAIICVRKDASAFMRVDVLHLLVWDELSVVRLAQLIPRHT
jgi:hypothetical protein